MKKRILLLAVYLLLAFVLPGCWDYREYEDMAQVTAMCIDYDMQSEETTITIQYPAIKRGKGGEPSEPQWIVYSATAQTVFAALTKLQEIVPRRLFFGYLKLVVVGEVAAKYTIMDLLDVLDRTPVMRSSAYLVITSGKAEDVLKTKDPSQLASSDKIHKLIRDSRDSGTTSAVTLNDFLQMLAIGGWEATAPRVISEPAKSPKPESKEGQGNTQKNGNSQEEQPATLRVSGMAAFQGDKFTGWLDDRESLGLNFIRGKKIRAYKTSEPVGGADIEELYYRLLDTSSKIKVHMENDQLVISVNVKVVADMRKYYRNEGSDFLASEAISVAEKKLSDSIRSDIDAALIKGQQDLKSDIFGFGFALFRKDPKLWQQEYEAKWADIFPDIPVNVNIDAKIINTGITERKLYIK